MSDTHAAHVGNDASDALKAIGRRRARRRVAAIAVLALVCASVLAVAIRSHALSSAYAQGDSQTFAEEVDVVYPGAEDVVFFVEGAGYLNDADAQTICPDAYEEASEAAARFKMYKVDLAFTNNGKADCPLDELLHSVLAIGDAYGNGVNYRASEEASGGSLPTSVSAGEEIRFTFVYTVYDYSFTEEQWSNIEAERTRFIFSMWPRVESIELR